MSKNPKIEFFKIELNPTSSDEDVTFKSLFKKIYCNLNPESDDVDRKTDDELKKSFYEYFFSKIDTTYNNDERRKKAFYSKPDIIDGESITPINLSIAQSKIDGIIKGGHYGTGKDIGNVANPEEETEVLSNEKILLDDFYFSLYTPLDKKMGVLILQSYTRDQIADIFRPFIIKMFKVSSYTYNAKIKSFMPEEMQNAFKENSIVKNFNFSRRLLINNLDEDAARSGEFSVSIKITSLDNNINLNNLPKWRRAIGQTALGLPNIPDDILLEDFNNRNAVIRPNGGRTNGGSFNLYSESPDIKATIFLEDYIRVEVDSGKPDWGQLRIFAQETLDEMVKPEIYPEDYLNED